MPALNCIKVINRFRAAHFHQFLKRRLSVADIIDGPALQNRRFPRPCPGKREPGMTLGQNRAIEARFLPGFSTIGRDFDPRDRPTP